MLPEKKRENLRCVNFFERVEFKMPDMSGFRHWSDASRQQLFRAEPQNRT